jgi:hypothetical protein
MGRALPLRCKAKREQEKLLTIRICPATFVNEVAEEKK